MRGFGKRNGPVGMEAEADKAAGPELWAYRERTLALLHRYFRMSIEVGRLPSILGREFFRAEVSHYRAQTFEDAVVFVLDVEQCLERLDELSRRLIAYRVFQDYTQEETARRLHCSERTVRRRYPEALDHVTQLFQESGILETVEPPRRGRRICAQADGLGLKAAGEREPAFLLRALVAAQACQGAGEAHFCAS